MPKADTILQIVGVAAIAALGLPVALSVKYRDGKVTADEIQEALGALVWKIEVNSPASFSSLRIRLESVKGEERETIATLEAAFDNRVKTAEAGVFLMETKAQLRCAKLHSEGILPPSIRLESLDLHDLGGTGIEAGPNTFRLADDGDRSLQVVFEVD